MSKKSLMSKCPECKEKCYTMDWRIDEITIKCPNCGYEFVDERLC